MGARGWSGSASPDAWPPRPGAARLIHTIHMVHTTFPLSYLPYPPRPHSGLDIHAIHRVDIHAIHIVHVHTVDMIDMLR
jgi:hypothetical protein